MCLVSINIDEAALCEDLWRAIEQDPELTLKPSDIVESDGEAIDLESFRADLHKMIEEVYAEA